MNSFLLHRLNAGDDNEYANEKGTCFAFCIFLLPFCEFLFADLPESEAAELQNKLEVLNNIMDQEVREPLFFACNTIQNYIKMLMDLHKTPVSPMQ